MDLGIFKLISTVTTGLIELTSKVTSTAVLTTTALETCARTLNHAAEMAETAVIATRKEMDVEFAETLMLMKAAAEERVKAANAVPTTQSKSPSK